MTPAFNRAAELPFLIESIGKQTLASDLFEMILVDDGSTDTSAAVVKEWIAKVDFQLRYIKKENEGPGAARNEGVEESQGELLMFIDSDCEADPDWLKTIYEKYTDEKFDACGGPDASKGDFTPLQRAIDFSMTSFLTTGGLRGHSHRPLAKFYPRSHNMGMTLDLYRKVGGFGELRHGQDIELSHRIIKSGATVAHVADAVVYHRRRTSLRRFFRQVFNWGVARVNLGKIDRKMLEPLHFVPSTITLVSCLVMLGFFADPEEFGAFFELGLGLLLALSILGAIRQRDATVAPYLPLVICAQIFGYGFGFMLAFFKRFILGQDEWVGFSKKYYD
ncbi:MAG: glycosyltransferase [Candidatus Marinimicrobia bacterium]|nr:glycosyltransferase [Candidatus Neomarinimicrobiota bacterium]MDP6836867.1 glycosyltransferase [Candidatus Neomarinimicrobiota bacterium]